MRPFFLKGLDGMEEGFYLRHTLQPIAGTIISPGDKMGPLDADHPCCDPALPTANTCVACKESFVAGDYVTLIPLGPGADPEERQDCAAGKFYNAICAVVHWTCATGKE